MSCPCEENETSGNVAETLRVDSVNDIHAAGRAELQQDRGHRLHVFHCAKLVGDFDGHGRAAERQKNGRGRRLKHNVRANALDALGRLLQQAAGQPHDQDDQRDLHANRYYADDRADRAVQHVIDNQLADHGLGTGVSSPTCSSSVPAGCASSKRSGEIGSLSVSFRMRISSL